MAEQLANSGQYKDVKVVSAPATDSEGNGVSGLIDVTYEQMKFANAPGDFTKKKPSLSMAQMREMQNPTPSMAEVEANSDSGLIEAARSKFESSSPAAGLIQRFR